jgi:ABC-type glycerol-3-phosphate transport system substrate-binding protein
MNGHYVQMLDGVDPFRGVTRRWLGRLAFVESASRAFLGACGDAAPAAPAKVELTKARAGAPAPATAQPAPTDAVTAPSLPKRVSLEAWCHGDKWSARQIKTLEDGNKVKGLGLKVNWTLAGTAAEVADKLVVTIAGGSGFPDIADVETSQMGKLLKTATPPLVAYNDYLKGTEADLIKAATLDPWSLAGEWYGMGNELNVVLYAYRTDVFAKVGVTTPIKTWDDVIEAGTEVKAVASEGIYQVRADPAGSTHMLAVPAGGGIFTADGKMPINRLPTSWRRSTRRATSTSRPCRRLVARC